MSNWLAAPTDSSGFEPQNRLLSGLPRRELLSLQPYLEPVPLPIGRALFDAGEPLTRLYFVESGVAALLTTCEDRAIGVAAVGREGAVDVQSLLLGGGTALGRCQILVPGSALAVAVSPFRSALRKSPKLRAACETHTRALLVQMLQAVPCNRLHTVEQRCARWLLTYADRAMGDTFELAMDGFAQVLGAPASTTIVILRRLHNEGLIRYGNGALTVVDRVGLEAATCECYQIVRGRYR